MSRAGPRLSLPWILEERELEQSMSGSLCLNGKWGLTWAEGAALMSPDQYTAAGLRGRRLMEVPVPASIHAVLMDKGLIDDPNIGLNSLKARWVEEQFWIYRHTFAVPEEALRQNAWLIFEKLEFEAKVLLNGEEIGQHANAHRPGRFEVTGKLRAGENLLVVRLSTGMHAAADKPGAEYAGNHIDLLTKRPWHRKPQYQGGWDWNARLMNVGILGDVKLEWHPGPVLEQVAVFALPSPDLKSAKVHVRAFVNNPAQDEIRGTLRARISEAGQEASLPVRIGPGESHHELTIDLPGPRLWWPIGQGEQHRYTIDVELETPGDTQSAARKTGVRRIEIDQSAHPEVGQYFIIRVNNRPIFCKGGNWVPPDLLYSTVTAERYRELVKLAIEANFNTLRVWGGGCFADHALCDACDEAGILIWHDFLFACCKYPGDHPEFAAEVRREVSWAVRDLAHHPSIVVWCGNNEIEWGDWNWGYDNKLRTHPHYAMFHHDIPAIATRENPATAYWISSPYSPEYKEPNDPTVGDQHPWGVSILEPCGADFWKYRQYVDRFPNEGGVIGISSPATLRQFLPEDQCRLLSPAWDHHDNPFACTSPKPGELGRAYATVEMWTGRNPEKMDWEDYAFVSALLQAEGLQEYIANYRRRMFSSSSAIFWMYNDSWPVTHGWTIVDYYLRKKLAYHPVRRAFQPVRVVVAEDNREVVVFGVNDAIGEWSGQLRFGLFQLAGGPPVDENKAVTLPPNASTAIARIDRSRWEKLGLNQTGAFAVLSAGGQMISQHRLFLERFKDLKFIEPKVNLSLKHSVLTLSSQAFAWGVCLDVDGEVPVADNCFDLLPGVPYTLPWPSTLGEPRVVRVGNRDAVKPR
jgi:beta-mannosidase